MPMSKEQALAAKRKRIEEEFGGNEELYRAAMSALASKGGKAAKGNTGFGLGEIGRKRASAAGRKGAISKRMKKHNDS